MRAALISFIAGYSSIAVFPVLQAAPVEKQEYEEQLIVSGTRLKSTADELPLSAFILSSDEMSRRAKNSTIDLFRTIPGLQIGQQGGPGGVSVLYMRGGEPNFTTVMIDGVVVNDPSNSRGGSFDFSSLETHQIERVEVVNGPQSALYGSGSLSGSINLITRSGKRENNRVSAELGDHGSFKSGLTIADQLGRNAYRLDIGRIDAGEPTAGSTFSSTYAGGKLEADIANSSLRLAIRYADSDRSSFPEDSGGPNLAVLRTLDTESLEDLSSSLRIDTDLTETISSFAVASYYSRQADFLSPGIVAPNGGIPARGDKTDYERTEIELGAAWIANEQIEVLLGVNAQLEDGKDDGFVFFEFFETDFQLERETYGTVMEAHLTPIDSLMITFGVRYDDTDTSADTVNEAIGAAWAVNGETTEVFFNYSTGFKLPSFFALGNALVGNPDLLPEESRTWQTGIRHRIATWGTTLKFELYKNEYKNLIDFDEQLFTNVNRSLVESHGADLSAQIVSSERGWELRAFVSYLDLDVISSADLLRGRPQWHAGISGHVPLSNALGMNIDYMWNDTTLEAALPLQSMANPNGLRSLAAYSRIDLSFRYQASKTLTLQFSIDNLLDEHFEEAVGFTAPGIESRLGVSYAFGR